MDVLELTLARLDEDDVAALVASAWATPRPNWRRLFAESEGNPFFVTEYLALVQRAGTGHGNAVGDARRRRDLLLAPACRGRDRAATADRADHRRTFAFDLLRDVSGRSEEEASSPWNNCSINASSVRRRAGLRLFPRPTARAGVCRDRHGTRRLLHRRVADALLVDAAHGPGRGRAARSSPTIACGRTGGRRGRPICARRTMLAARLPPTLRPFIIYL
ncbi:MAG: hypothetical protein R2851_22295 [Caldilineaceae bacterium]